MGDVLLKLYTIPVIYKSGRESIARAEGNNAAWHCDCGESLPLLGRCYFQFGHDCHTICPICNRSYRVMKDQNKKALKVIEY